MEMSESIQNILKMSRQIGKVDLLGGRDSFFGMMEIFEIILEEEHSKENETGMYRFKGMEQYGNCLLYTSPSPRDRTRSRMPSSA